MAKSNRRKSGNPANAAWQPLVRGTPNPAAAIALGEKPPEEAWGNDIYQVTVEYATEGDRSGPLYLSLTLHDRLPIRDWRHFQQIKNEVAGPEREAVELFPAESRLIDTANQYHLWVAPEGVRLELGYEHGYVTNDEQVEAFNAGRERGEHKGRQRPWQAGLTTGRNELTPGLPQDQVERFERGGWRPRQGQ